MQLPIHLSVLFEHGSWCILHGTDSCNPLLTDWKQLSAKFLKCNKTCCIQQVDVDVLLPIIKDPYMEAFPIWNLNIYSIQHPIVCVNPLKLSYKYEGNGGN